MSLLDKLGLADKKKKPVDLSLLNREERRKYKRAFGIKIKGSVAPIVILKK